MIPGGAFKNFRDSVASARAHAFQSSALARRQIPRGLRKPIMSMIGEKTAEKTPSHPASPTTQKITITVPTPPAPVLSDAQDMVDAFGDKVPEDGAASQSELGYAADAVTGALFSVLHFGDDSGIEDSSKNLRVLWARALLHEAGELDDPVAYELLPRLTRDVAKWDALKPLARFAEFVTSRTQFIDAAVDRFLEANAKAGGSAPQIVVLGAGFDTRAMRYAAKTLETGATFFELDLPQICAGKDLLWDRWAKVDGRSAYVKPTYVPYDLNDAGDPNKVAPLDALEAASFRRDRPTLFCSEAVLFYVDDLPKRRLFQDLLFSASIPESAVVLTDNLKPLLTSPFTHEARALLEASGLDLLKHSARWGGTVHYAFAARLGSSILDYLSADREDTTVSYLPVVSQGSRMLQLAPSFERAWYAVCFASQLERQPGDDQDELGYSPFSTRLFGEPMVIYRDASGEINACADACPHRSAPLSMGRVSPDGSLRCFYHGWEFGKDGVRTDAESYRADGSLKRNACKLKNFAVAEVDGIVYVWRGRLLEADPSLLPRKVPDATPTYATDTVLDYNVGFEYIVENNLDSVHLFALHDGSIPPLASLGMQRSNTEKLQMKPFSDDVGPGHIGKLKGAVKPNKLVRFDAPNIVRHGGVSGFHEEFHIVPIAPKRTRVLLRQHLPKGPILTTLTGVPGVPQALDTLVKNWNYHIGLEDYSVMQGQAHLIDDLGAPRIKYPGKGDDLIAKFYAWYGKAIENDGGLPYFARWTGDDYERQTVPAGTEPRDFTNVDDNPLQGTVGIKETFHAVHPVAAFPPANPELYLPKWNAQAALFRALGVEPPVR